MDDKPKHSARQEKRLGGLGSRPSEHPSRDALDGVYPRRRHRVLRGLLREGQSDFMASLGFPVESPRNRPAPPRRRRRFTTPSPCESPRSRICSPLQPRFVRPQTSTYGMVDAMMKSTRRSVRGLLHARALRRLREGGGKSRLLGIGVLFAEIQRPRLRRRRVPRLGGRGEGRASGRLRGRRGRDSSRRGRCPRWSRPFPVRRGSVVVTWMRPTSLDAEKGSEFTTMLTCQKFDGQNVTTSLDDTVGHGEDPPDHPELGASRGGCGARSSRAGRHLLRDRPARQPRRLPYPGGRYRLAVRSKRRARPGSGDGRRVDEDGVRRDAHRRPPGCSGEQLHLLCRRSAGLRFAGQPARRGGWARPPWARARFRSCAS